MEGLRILFALFVVLFYDCLGIDNVYCPLVYKYYPPLQSCIGTMYDPTDHTTAKRKCQKEGGQLVKADTRDKMHWTTSTLLINSKTWIGLVRSRGVYKWTDGDVLNQKTNYSGFKTGAPPANDNKANCVYLNPERDFAWEQAPCNNMYSYLCELKDANLCRNDNGGCSTNKCISLGYKKIICSCPQGLKNKSLICLHLNPCETNNGGCDQLCVYSGYDKKCTCHAGYSLKSNKSSVCQKNDPVGQRIVEAKSIPSMFVTLSMIGTALAIVFLLYKAWKFEGPRLTQDFELASNPPIP